MSSHRDEFASITSFKEKCRLQSMLVRHLEECAASLPSDILRKHICEIDAILTPRITECFRGSYVYVLQLQNDCVYVGMSEQIVHRLADHFAGNGSLWTKTNPPMYVLEIQPGSRSVEREKTLQYMRTHGWRRVRGSVWCRLEMTHPPPEIGDVDDVTSAIPPASSS
jgi:predicted GIY-YIG superfamily endonuclease